MSKEPWTYPTLTELTGRSSDELFQLLQNTDIRSRRTALFMAIFTADTPKASKLDPELRKIWKDLRRAIR